MRIMKKQYEPHEVAGVIRNASEQWQPERDEPPHQCLKNYSVNYMVEKFCEEENMFAGWRSFDNVLMVATLDSIEELGDHVISPQAFSDTVKRPHLPHERSGAQGEFSLQRCVEQK